MESKHTSAPAAGAQTQCRMESAILAMVLGHQLGQVSERRWWRALPDGNDAAVTVDALLCADNLHYLVDDPPAITTPGWGPTCFTDTVPHIYALSQEYGRLGHALTPEDFRDFLLRERHWLRLQGVGRSCLELMAEGMNPRIAGLYAASVVSGCWVAWPVALYHAGFPDDAYEDAVKLARTLSGGDIVPLTGLLSAMLSTAFVLGSDWKAVRATLLRLTEKRGSAVQKQINEALSIGRESVTQQDWMQAMRSREFLDQVSVFGAGIDWMSSFYAALSVLEFSFTHDLDWPEFAQGILASCDARFGAMIAFSIRAALGGVDSLPGGWLQHARDVHADEVQAWVSDAYDTLGRKLAADCETARGVLAQIEGNPEESEFYGKVLAVMLAGAAGNVMGSPVEDRDYPWIEERYGVLDRILDPKRLDTEDDSAMAIMWAETYINCDGRIYPEDLADTFLRKMTPTNFYYDTQHSFNMLRGGLPPHACGHWNVVTGSGLMGCYPCGVFHAGNPQAAAVDGLELAYHYQRGFDVHAPAILCAATAHALCRGATVQSVLEAAVGGAPLAPQAYFGSLENRDARLHLQRALEAVENCTDVLSARKVLYDGFLEYNGQDPWEVVVLTLAIFKVAKGDVWQSMIGGTNIGRDSDTISSQAAILSAGLNGMKGIPDHVLSLFNGEALAKYRGLAMGMTKLVQSRHLYTLETAKQLGAL